MRTPREMLATDIHMHTVPHDPTQRSQQRLKTHLVVDTKSDSKSDVMRTFDEFTSKFKKRTSWLDSANSSSRRNKHEHDVTAFTPPRYIQEPTTPEDQVFGASAEKQGMTPTSVPELTPDDNPFGGVSASKSRGSSGVRRKPVHHEFFRGESPIKPLVLQGLSYPSAPPKFAPGETCGFCDMSLGATFLSETAVRMQCGHAAHRECRDNLVRVCLEYGDEIPTCPICDGSVMTPDFNPKALAVEPVSKPTLLAGFEGSSDPEKPQPGTLAQILTPEIQAVAPPKPVAKPLSGRRSLKDALTSSVSSASSSIHSPEADLLASPKRPVSIDSMLSETGSSVRTCSTSNDMSNHISHSSIRSELGLYHSKINDLRASPSSQSATCETNLFRVNATGYVSRTSKKPETSQVALWVQAPEYSPRDSAGHEVLRDSMFQYRTTAKDVQSAISLKREVESFVYKGKPLRNVQNGMLRLYSNIRVTSPERELLDWPDTHAYLFENSLILVTAPDNRVRAVLDAAAAIGSADTQASDPTVARLKPTDPKIPELHFHTESRSAAHMWVTAFVDSGAQFPLHPTNYDTYLEKKEAEIELNGGVILSPSSGRAPAEIVLCMPYLAVISSPSIQQDIRKTITELQPCDSLALILYSADKIEKQVGLQRPFWYGWKSFFEELASTGKSHHKKDTRDATIEPLRSVAQKQVKTFDQLFDAIKGVLENHNIHMSAASVVLISDDDTKLGELPREFQSAKIPINCIGLSESHDALTLSTLARSTSGTYAYTKQIEGLGQLLASMVKLEMEYTTSDVIVRLRSRIGTEIKNFRQPILDANNNIKNYDADARVVEWHLGKLRRGDLRSLVFDVKGLVPQNQPVVQVSIECIDALGVTKSSTSFRVDAPSTPSEDKDEKEESLPQSLLETECALNESFKVFEDVLASLITENNRKAFQSLSSGLSEVKQRLDNIPGSLATSFVYRRILEILGQMFDQQCDAIIEHKLLTRDFVLESLQRLWLFSTRRSLASRDPLERFYA